MVFVFRPPQGSWKLSLLILSILMVVSCQWADDSYLGGPPPQQEPLQPLGWSIVKLNDTGMAKALVPSITLDGILPGGSGQIRIGSYLENGLIYPRTGVVYSHLTPVWADPDGGRLVTRLSKGETITILRKESWRINRGNIAHLYFIEDTLGNRGYAGSESLVIPLGNLGDLTLSILETFSLEYVSEPPWNQHRVFGRQRILPVIHRNKDFFALVPQDEKGSFNLGNGDLSHMIVGTSPPIGERPAYFFVAVSQVLPNMSSILSLSGFTIENSEPQAVFQEAFSLPYQILEVSTPRIVNSLNDFLEPGNSSLLVDLGVVLEYAGIGDHVLIGQARGWSLNSNPTSSELLSLGLPTQFRVVNTEPSAALRRGPGQSFGVISRLPAGSPLDPLEIHVPSTVIQNLRGFWVRVSTPDDQGWIWGGFLSVQRL